MTEIFIYVIELEEKNYFIHRANQKFSFEVLIECEIYYDFAKIHKPLYIVDTLLEKDSFHVNNLVKQYMKKYGIQCVRGGSYTDITLSPETEAFLTKECTLHAYPTTHDASYREILQKYLIREWNSEELEREHTHLLKEYQQYQTEKQKKDAFQFFTVGQITYEITANIIQEIEQLRDFCKHPHNTREDKLLYKKTYHQLLPKLQHIMKTYAQHCQHVPTEYIFYVGMLPDFFLDVFLYVYNFSPRPTEDIGKIDRFFEAVLSFTNWLLCRIQEYTFDVASWRQDIEWMYPRIFYVLEKTKESHEKGEELRI